MPTITGFYTLAPNPCTTTPCLPGLAYALQAGGEQWFVTLDGHWFADDRSWSGYRPEPGDRVTISGPVGERTDVRGEPFRVIEAVTLRRAP